MKYLLVFDIINYECTISPYITTGAKAYGIINLFISFLKAHGISQYLYCQ